MAERRKILITGGSGQVGTALAELVWPDEIEIVSPGRAELDLAQPSAILDWLASHPCNAIVNAGAYTAVDAAENEPALAFSVNACAPAALAQYARGAGIPLVQISTDYVFDGQNSRAYLENDETRPLGVYGTSKLAGELAVSSSRARAVVVRTAWVLSAGGRNFADTMLRLARDRGDVRVVSDQLGCPTAATDLAAALQGIVLKHLDDPSAPTGVFHFANAGEASWADLARRIFARSAALGGPTARVHPINTSDYPTPAKRPANSRLDTSAVREAFDLRIRPWEDAVDELVTTILTRKKP